MDPFIAEIREREREAFRAYQRKRREYFEAKDKLKHNGWLGLEYEDEELVEEYRKLDFEQLKAWADYKSVQRDCERMEWEWTNRPQVEKEPL